MQPKLSAHQATHAATYAATYAAASVDPLRQTGDSPFALVERIMLISIGVYFTSPVLSLVG